MELESVSEIGSPRWSSVYECQSVECAFTSPVIIELGMLVMYCFQFVMSVYVVSMVVVVVVVRLSVHVHFNMGLSPRDS